MSQHAADRRAPVRRISRSGLFVGVVGLVVASGFAGNLIARHGGDPTIFASFGENPPEITEYAEQLLGREVVVREGLGHDGRFFFVQAIDPWLTDAGTYTELMDRPSYRAQRFLYPFLAGGGGLLGPDAIVWALIAVNVLAMGLGTWAVAELAMDMGGSAWWGLAFVLNVGFVSEMNIDAAGVVAAAAAFWALVMLRRGRLTHGVVLLATAALAREAMLIVAVGSAYWLWRKGREKGSLLAVGLPAATVLIWGLFVRIRLGFPPDTAEVEEIGWPFVGFVRALEGWLSNPVDLAAGLAILLLLLLFARRALMSGEIVGWAFLGFVGLALVFTRQVWFNYFDISRAIAPTITAFVLLLFAAGDEPRSSSRRVERASP